MPAKKQKSKSPWLPVVLLLLVVLLIVVYRYSVKHNAAPDRPAATGDNSNLLLGNPTHAVHATSSPNNYLIDHLYYTVSYNSSKGTPNWVSWHLGSSDLGTTERQDNFRADENLPVQWYAANAASYKNSGFDKGHCCPSGDRTATVEANAATFLMDNIIPQAPNNNQYTWEHLESYCRNQVKKGAEVYVVTGNYGTGGTGRKGYTTTLDRGNINVPAHIWKVAVIIPEGNNDLARINEDTRVIAIDTPNENTVSNNWMDYITTVSHIEQRCNCDLLSALPLAVQQQLENKKFRGGN